jgi:hypothetical protein
MSRGEFNEKWGKLTDDDLSIIERSGREVRRDAPAEEHQREGTIGFQKTAGQSLKTPRY